MHVMVKIPTWVSYTPKYPKQVEKDDATNVSIAPGFTVGWVSDSNLEEYDPFTSPEIVVLIELPGDTDIHLTVPFGNLKPIFNDEMDSERAAWVNAMKRHNTPVTVSEGGE